MRLMDYSAPKRLELVALALNMVLQDLREPADTVTVCEQVCRRLETDERQTVARMLTNQIAPRIPEAARSGATFRMWGRTMQRWEWWPKGTTAEGRTRAAKRGDTWTPTAWRGKLYATREALEAAQTAAGYWEV